MRSSSLWSTWLREGSGRVFLEPSCQAMARCVQALCLCCLSGLSAAGFVICVLMTVQCQGLCGRLLCFLQLLLRALLLLIGLCSCCLAVSSRLRSLESHSQLFSITHTTSVFYSREDFAAPLATSLRVPAAARTLGFFSLCPCRLTAERSSCRKVL